MNCFSGTAASVLKAPLYFFVLLSKIKMNKKIQLHNIVIGNDYAVPLGRCGPLGVMWGCLFTLNSI